MYAAVGLGVQSIYGRLDFETLVTNRLLPEIRNKEPRFDLLIPNSMLRWFNISTSQL